MNEDKHYDELNKYVVKAHEKGRFRHTKLQGWDRKITDAEKAHPDPRKHYHDGVIKRAKQMSDKKPVTPNVTFSSRQESAEDDRQAAEHHQQELEHQQWLEKQKRDKAEKEKQALIKRLNDPHKPTSFHDFVQMASVKKSMSDRLKNEGVAVGKLAAGAEADVPLKKQGVKLNPKQIDKEAGHLTNEENIDEISRGLLRSYINKADTQAVDARFQSYKTAPGKTKSDLEALSKKREAGVNRAETKLDKKTNESVLNKNNPHEDYRAKSKELQDLSRNKDVDQKAVQQRRLDLDKEYKKYQTEAAVQMRQPPFHPREQEKISSADSAPKGNAAVDLSSDVTNSSSKSQPGLAGNALQKSNGERTVVDKNEKLKKQIFQINPKMGENRSYSFSRVQETIQEDEQLDELSKKTLGSYVNKAARNVATKTRLSKDFEKYADNALVKADKHNWNGPHGSYKPVETKHSEDEKINSAISKDFKAGADKRLKGIATATKKLTKEDVEELDELSKNTLQNYVGKALVSIHNKGFKSGQQVSTDPNSAFKAATSSIKRQINVRKAVNKLANEEVEQVDEISKKTLGSYINNAATDAASSAYAGKEHDPKLLAKSFKRLAGIKKATSKLTKEEIEQVDELKKSTLASYVTKAHKDNAMKANDLGHQLGSSKEPGTIFQSGYLKQKGQYLKRSAGIDTAVKKLAKEEMDYQTPTPIAFHMSDLVRCHQTGKLGTVIAVEGDLITVEYANDGTTSTGPADWWTNLSTPIAQTDITNHTLDDIARRKMVTASKLGEEVDKEALKKEYKKNEDENRHSENAVLLAKHFGSKRDQNQAAKAMAYRDKHGGYGADTLGRHHANLSHEVHKKLHGHLFEETINEAVERSWNVKHLKPVNYMQDLTGKKVRSYDFPGVHDSHYMEGHVMSHHGDQAHIRTTKVVRGNKEEPISHHNAEFKAHLGLHHNWMGGKAVHGVYHAPKEGEAAHNVKQTLRAIRKK